MRGGCEAIAVRERPKASRLGGAPTLESARTVGYAPRAEHVSSSRSTVDARVNYFGHVSGESLFVALIGSRFPREA
jgi:hypothetical protein